MIYQDTAVSTIQCKFIDCRLLPGQPHCNYSMCIINGGTHTHTYIHTYLHTHTYIHTHVIYQDTAVSTIQCKFIDCRLLPGQPHCNYSMCIINGGTHTHTYIHTYLHTHTYIHTHVIYQDTAVSTIQCKFIDCRLLPGQPHCNYSMCIINGNTHTHIHTYIRTYMYIYTHT